MLHSGCSLAEVHAGYTRFSPQIQGGLSIPSPAAVHNGNLSKRNAGAALGSSVTGWPPLCVKKEKYSTALSGNFTSDPAETHINSTVERNPAVLQ